MAHRTHKLTKEEQRRWRRVFQFLPSHVFGLPRSLVHRALSGKVSYEAREALRRHSPAADANGPRFARLAGGAS